MSAERSSPQIISASGSDETTVRTLVVAFAPALELRLHVAQETAGAGHVEAVSRVLHKGRTTIVVETDLRDADGKHVARVTQTQAVL